VIHDQGEEISEAVVRIEGTGSVDVEQARWMLNKLVGDAETGSVGLVDPFIDHRHRPLLEHLDNFRRYLIANTCTETG
jgi:hypothetical protein